MTMAYIIFVNPLILSDAGMDQGAVTTATILAAAITTFLMGVYVNYPFALASGMGLNAFFAYTVAANYGWQAALGAVFISGIVFFILAVTNAITYTRLYHCRQAHAPRHRTVYRLIGCGTRYRC